MYVNGGSEEEWMNRLADAMIPYLNASGNISLYHDTEDRHIQTVLPLISGEAALPSG